MDNIEELCQLMAGSGKLLEFIVAIPGRCYGEFVELQQPLHAKALATSSEFVGEAQWQGHRLVVAHNPARTLQQTRLGQGRTSELQARATQLAGKLDCQDAGEFRRGRRLSDSGAKARFFHEVSEARLASIIKVGL